MAVLTRDNLPLLRARVIFTAKNNIRIIQSVYRCELNQPDDSTMVMNISLKAGVCLLGKAKAKANQLHRSHLPSFWVVTFK